jgi:cyclophilin family peptidyl-prolyl cis-trans isomerase
VTRPLALLVLTLALIVAGCGDSDSGGNKESGSADSGGSTTTAPGGCEDVQAPAPKPDGGAHRPVRALQTGKTYDVTLSTTCGDMTIRLDLKTAPTTAASFVSLVRSHFYDNTVFHRIVPGFVIQGGDPTGSGNGGPGYSTRDKPPADAKYTRGVVAMAKTAQEPAGTAGSQFYVVTGADAGLPPDYALLGKLVKGLATAKRIDALGDPQSGEVGTPLRPVVLKKASVSVS